MTPLPEHPAERAARLTTCWLPDGRLWRAKAELPYQPTPIVWMALGAGAFFVGFCIAAITGPLPW